jgi:hypothetical protein
MVSIPGNGGGSHGEGESGRRERDMRGKGADCQTVFAGKDASRALAQSSLKPEDCVPEWEDLGDKEKKVLDDWVTFFSKRYSVVGKVTK